MRLRDLALLFCVGFAALPASAGEAPIVIVASGSGKAYAEAEAGIREVLGVRLPRAPLEIVTLGAKDPGDDALALVRSRDARLVITLGDRATDALATRLAGTPLVAGMIVRARPLPERPNATAVELEFPASTELRWLRELLPHAKRIGVLYDPKRNASRIAEASLAAQRAGLELVARPVDSPNKIPEALKALENVDAIWGVPDETVLSAATARTILTFAFSNRIPISGPSDSWVKAGALYALDRDYRDIGRQCGELGSEILGGRSAADLPVQKPRIVLYSLNARAFDHMKLEVPGGALLAKATAVYR
jgi:putative ABC transport system substrate-binding protein